mgnify:CR=1 FL=1|tara:strand:+ start:15913 stop:16473 length:561 start_codon:yes stop_codon:yes gene_type:complete
MLNKDENKHYIGYHKAVVGVCSDKDQLKYLSKHCDIVHDSLQDAIDDMSRGNEILVVMNEVVLGSGQKIFKTMKELCALGASLYSVVDEKLYDCCVLDDIDSAIDAKNKRKNTVLSERKGRAKGGRPPLLTLDDKKEIYALIKSGKSFAKLRDDYNTSNSTLNRIVLRGNKELWITPNVSEGQNES